MSQNRKEDIKSNMDSNNGIICGDPMAAYLKEYDSLRSEQMKRLEFQHQAVNYLLIVLGVAISTFAASMKLTSDAQSSAEANFLFRTGIWILLFLPLVTAPLGFIFFDNEMAIHSIGSHLNWRFKPKVVELVKSSPLLMNVIDGLRRDDRDFIQAAVREENLLFGTSLDFFFLFNRSEGIHKTLSSGKWILFLLPTIGPVVMLGGWRLLFAGDCAGARPCSFEQLAGYEWLLDLGIVIYVIDVLVCIPLLIAVWWTFVKYRNIKRH